MMMKRQATNYFLYLYYLGSFWLVSSLQQLILFSQVCLRLAYTWLVNTRHILNRSIISTSSPLRYSVVTFNDWPSTSSTRSWIGLDGRKTNLLKSYSNKRGELYMLNLNANMAFGTDKPFNQFYPHQSINHWLVVIMVRVNYSAVVDILRTKLCIAKLNHF